MSRSLDEIVQLYHQRYDRLTPMHQAALDVRAAYYNEVTLPLPELDRVEKPLVANFVYSAGQQMAMRVASTMPDPRVPSTKPGQKAADQRARDRRNILLSWWDAERMKLKMRKRARHIVYYAGSPVILLPNFKHSRPTWKIRNPLATFAPEMDDGDVIPPDVIFTYPKDFGWIARNYPAAREAFGAPDMVADGPVTVLEYQDDTDYVLCAVGEKLKYPSTSFGGYQAPPERVKVSVELSRVPNRVGRCTAVLASGIGLEQARGSFDGTIGMWQALGKLMALETIGMQRSIYPEEWLIDDPNSDGASIVTHADPLRGITGHVTGGKLEIVHPLPEAFSTNIMDRLERGIRIEGGVPAELGGESTSNIRTGKRGDQILSAVLDFPIQEMQEIMAVCLQEENKVAIAIDKAYFPTAKTIALAGTAGQITYQANDTWETDVNFTAYAHAGVDAQGLVIELGQMVGTGMMSKRSAMETHPMIEDAQSEFDRITVEHLRDGLLAGLAQMAQDPNMAPVIAQTLIAAKQSETEVEDAVLQVHQALQAMQAQQAQQQAPPGAPGASPEGQPGMGQPIPPIGAPPAGLTNLTSLLQSLRKGPLANVPNQLGIAS
jgi:hypothetical protein